MPKGGHGRGVIAAIGLLLLFAGLLGGGVLWILADREPESAAETFARALPGCTTTLTFGEPGEFFVFEELSGIVAPVDGCQPSTLPGRPFTFTVVTTTGVEVPRVADDSVAYDLDVGSAMSVARITIPEAGEYRISVLGSDPAVVAAVGGDPADGVEQLRRGAIAAVAGGLVLGGFLLWLSARRSKRATRSGVPIDPGWGVTERDHARREAAKAEGWSPVSPDVRQVPVNPLAPDDRPIATSLSVGSEPVPGLQLDPTAPLVVSARPPAPPTLAMPEPSVTTEAVTTEAVTTEVDDTEVDDTEVDDTEADDTDAPDQGIATSPAVAWPSDLDPDPGHETGRGQAGGPSSEDEDPPA